ncbi:NACHT domain-containing protein [Actinomadura nitritigenes]|uniref:NACHT domain-containing protein n=1 Tax=Actinomadura nitritigenes TaxID=134602 RepID=UPI003D93699F
MAAMTGNRVSYNTVRNMFRGEPWRWRVGAELIGRLAGPADVPVWRERWETAFREEQRHRRRSQAPPLPWLDEEPPPPPDRPVHDWEVRRPRVRARYWWGRLRSSWIRRSRLAWQREVVLTAVRRQAADITGRSEHLHRLPIRFDRLDPRGGRHRARPVRLPDGTGIVDLFDRSPALVVLGDAGAGKSTQLAHLALSLAERELARLRHWRDGADEPRDDGSQPAPLPFLLHLGTYRGEPLEEWLAAEINRSYDFAVAQVRSWVAEPGIVPLLDGLDQVPEAHRKTCAQQIRAFHAQGRAVAVTCRDRDYRLALRMSAKEYVAIRPPSRTEVMDYLLADEDALADVRAVLRTDKSLWELLRSPLMLDVIARTYAGRPASELAEPGGVAERRGRIFDAYLRRMLERPSRYPDRMVLDRLGWLARTMTGRGETVLYLDRVWGAWLPERRSWALVAPRNIFQIAVQALTLGWLAVAAAVTGVPIDFHAAIVALLALAAVSVVAVGTYRPRPGQEFRGMPGAVIPAVPAAAGALSQENSAPLLFLLTLLWAVLTGLAAGWTSGFAPVERLRWGWRRPVWTARVEFAAYGVIGFAMVVAVHMFAGRIPPGMAAASWGSGLVVLVVSLLDGFQPGTQQVRRRPDEGIHRSARYALGFGAVYAVATYVSMGLLLAVTLTPDLPASSVWTIAALPALLFGATTAYRCGGRSCLHYWTVRWLLARGGHAPLRYLRFLHDAEARTLLYRLGSGFVFPHRLVQEHLAGPADELAARLLAGPPA